MEYKKIKITFVCLGNICRSPAAESVFQKFVDNKGLSDNFEIDSCGLISYHQGESPDDRMISTLNRHGYKTNHRAKKITQKDFLENDYIICMDNNNYRELNQICPQGNNHKIHKISEFFPENVVLDSVPDPYYGDQRDFERVINLLESCLENIFFALGVQTPHAKN